MKMLSKGWPDFHRIGYEDNQKKADIQMTEKVSKLSDGFFPIEKPQKRSFCVYSMYTINIFTHLFKGRKLINDLFAKKLISLMPKKYNAEILFPKFVHPNDDW
jgi:hypothetical protein